MPTPILHVTSFKRSLFLATCALAFFTLVATTSAQEPARDKHAGVAQKTGAPKDITKRPDKSEHPAHKPGKRLLPGLHMFRPLPEDLGPLQPEERRQLIDFLREHAPDLHDSLIRLRERNPEAFNRQLEEAAPHLRRLQRIWDQNPVLGQRIVVHMQNMRKIHRARRALADPPQDQNSIRRLRRVLNAATAENVDIEIAVLEDQKREYESRRDELVQRLFDRITAPDADLTDQPPHILRLVDHLKSELTPDETQRLNDELWLACTERVDGEIDSIGRQLNHMLENRDAEINNRAAQKNHPRDNDRNRPPKHRGPRRP